MSHSQKSNEVSYNHLDLENHRVSSIFDQLDQTFQLPIPNNFQWLKWIFNLTVLVLAVIGRLGQNLAHLQRNMEPINLKIRLMDFHHTSPSGYVYDRILFQIFHLYIYTDLKVWNYGLKSYYWMIRLVDTFTVRLLHRIANTFWFQVHPRLCNHH